MKKDTVLKILIGITAGILAVLLAIAVMISIDRPQSTAPATTTATQVTTVPTQPTTVATEPPIVKESTFTLAATGDLLMHVAVMNTGKTSAGYNLYMEI